jgi:hypothetical protein
MVFRMLLVGATLLFVSLGTPSTSYAKGIPFIYNTGQECFATGPLPGDFAKHPDLAGFHAGYLCDIKGVMWSYFSVDQCKPAACQGDTYADDPELVAAVQAAYPESSMKLGIWGRFGWMFIALSAAIGGLLYLKDFLGKSGDDGEESAEKGAR